MIRAALLAFAVFVMLPSADGQWRLLDAPTQADFRGVHSVGGGVVWVSGSGGTVVRSEDMGTHWIACGVPPGAEKLDFRAVQGFDAATALVMSSGKGALSRVYKTTDGCRSWRLVLTNPDQEGFWDGLSMITWARDFRGHPLDVAHAMGTLVGDPVDGMITLFETVDGGETWLRRVAAKRGEKGRQCGVDAFAAKEGEAMFAASNESLMSRGGTHLVAKYLLFVTGGAVSRLGYRDPSSRDGDSCHDEARWIDLPMAHGSASAGAFAMAASAQRGSWVLPAKIIIVGGDYKLPDATEGSAVVVSGLRTPAQRVIQSATPPHGYRSAVAYDEGRRAWITVGPNGTDVSTDDGESWRAVRPAAGNAADADRRWNALSLPFAVGPKGRIGILEESALK